MVGLLGPNGSGKSTTLRLISTALLPDQGRILVNSFDTRSHGNAVRRNVSFAVASERSFFPRLTVRENLEFFAALENVSRREMKDRIESVLARTNLCDAANQQAMKLSSGTYQRLGIARALLKNPLILLLDEPTRSLDIAATTSLWDLVLEMSSTGITILLATHNFEEASAVCDRVAVLHKGQLIDRRAAQNLTAKQLRDFYVQLTSEKQHPESFPVEVPA